MSVHVDAVENRSGAVWPIVDMHILAIFSLRFRFLGLIGLGICLISAEVVVVDREGDVE